MPDIMVSGVMVQEGRIVLVRRRGEREWRLPGGPLADEDDTAEESLVRHLRRQLGVAPQEPEFIDTLYHRANGGTWLLENLFVVPGWSGRPTNAVPAELEEVSWYELSAMGYLPMDDAVRRSVQALLGLAPPLPAGVATRIILLTGPPGAGKSTVAVKLCERLGRAAHVDVDALRHMVTAGYASPVTSEDPVETARQVQLAVRNAGDLARNFAREGFHVVIDDVVLGGGLDAYAEALEGAAAEVFFVTLLPSLEEVQRRDRARPEEERMGARAEELWRAFQRAAEPRGLRLDTSGQTPDETADEVLARLDEAGLRINPA